MTSKMKSFGRRAWFALGLILSSVNAFAISEGNSGFIKTSTQPVSQIGSWTVTPGTGTWATSQSGSYTVTPGTGTFNTREQGSLVVTPGTGTWSTSQSGSYTVTPGTGVFNVTGSSVVAYQGGTWSLATTASTSTIVSTGSITSFQGGSWNVGQVGSYTITPGTGTFNTREQGSLTVTPGTGTWTTISTTTQNINIISTFSEVNPGFVRVTLSTIPVIVQGDLYSSYQPDPSSSPTGLLQNFQLDNFGRLETHGAVSSDEGSFRDDFPGTSLNSVKWSTVTGPGTSITVANSTVTLNAGTTSGSSVTMTTAGDYLPFTGQFFARVSQRVANQTIKFGFMDNYNPSAFSAMVVMNGTNNTVVNLVTQSTAGASNIQTSTATLPFGGITSTYHKYKIEASQNQVALSIDDVVVSTQQLHIPGPYDSLNIAAGINNSAIVTATTLNLDYVYFSNWDRLQIDNDFASEPIQVTPGSTALAWNTTISSGPYGQAVSVSTKQTPGNNFLAVQRPIDTNRTIFVATATAVAGVTTEALFNLAPCRNGVCGAATASIPVTSGKTLRLSNACVVWRAATAAQNGVIIRLRMNPTGVVAATSPIVLALGTAMTSSGSGLAFTSCAPFPEGIDLRGTMQIGATQLASGAVTGFDFTIQGFEY